MNTHKVAAWTRKSTNGRIIAGLLVSALVAIPAAAGGGFADDTEPQVADALSVPRDLSVLAAEVVPKRGFDARRLRHLHSALVERDRTDGPGFVFQFVALARERGIQAYFVAVDSRIGEVIRGVDLAAGIGHHGQIVVFDGTRVTRPDHGRLRLVEDTTATAVLLGEAGVERLAGGNPQGALERLEAAVRLDPDQAWIWSALGEAWRIGGEQERAMDAYQRSLELAALRTW